MKTRPNLNSDSYKQFHYQMYPKGLDFLYSNGTPGNFKYSGSDRAIFFSLQYYLKKYLIEEWSELFFNVDFEIIEKEYKRFHKHFSGVEDISIKHWKELHDLGFLPLSIKALPEGAKVKEKIPFFTIKNTVKGFGWLVNFIETAMSNTIWHGCVVATIAYQFRKIFDKYALETTGSVNGVEWQGHDFSMRGLSSYESTLSQSAWLTLFTGTDTIPAVLMLEEYYNADMERELIAMSVPASEHSIEMMWYDYKTDSEQDYLDHLLNEFPTGIFSMVSDGKDLWKVITELLSNNKDKILNRDGKLVIRPDCYDETTSVLTNNGWKLFKDLTSEDLVAQVLPDNSYEFVTPSKYVDQEYEGDMIRYKDYHGKVDLLVTPNHRMLWKNKVKGDIVKKAGTYKGTTYLNAMYRTASSVSNPDRILSPLERFKIAFQADGSYLSEGSTTQIVPYHTYRFNFKKDIKIKRLIEICEGAGFEYKISEENSRKGQSTIYVKVPKEETITKDFSWVDTETLTKEWCIDFIEELLNWDATISDRGRYKFNTTVKKVMDVVEYVAIGAGYGVLLSQSSNDRSEVFKYPYTANILTDNLVAGKSLQRTVEKYKGRIYCVTVPSGMLLVKRGRGTSVCGNSGDPVDILCGSVIKEYTSLDFAEGDFEDDIYSNQVHGESKVNIPLDKVVKVGKEYIKLTANIDWNRYDKQYYFIDNITVDHEIIEATPSMIGVVELLWNIFGGTINEQGYKVLDPHIGTIYGDSINLDRAERICQRLKDKGFASTNWIGGIGSYTLNMTSRNTIGFEMKTTAAIVDGEFKEIFKDPITDDGIKRSAKGLLRVDLDENGDYILKDQCTWEEEAGGELKTVFEDGKLLIDTSLSEIRERLK